MTAVPVFRQVLAHARRPATAARPALVCGDHALSYAELAHGVSERAAFLAAQCGVGPGVHVVLLAESSVDFVASYLAVHSLGAVCVPLDTHTSPDRRAAILRRLEPRVVISRAALDTAPHAGLRFEDVAAGASVPAPAIEVVTGQAADILFTTGTTSEAKGVILNHGALATACSHINQFIGTRTDAVEVLPLSLGHSFGLGRVRAVLSLGATLVLVPGGFVNSARITRALAEHRATGFASVPAGIAILLGEGDVLGRFADQLEYIEIGSSAMPLEHKRRLMELLPDTRLCMHYGLTEASRSAFLEFHSDQDRLDSIGRPSAGVELRVVDEDGKAAPAGEAGPLEVRGGHLMSGYWQDPARTAGALHDGWLRTGDLGRAGADGYFYLEARTDDVINVGGRKVLPQEIEEVLAEHPAIAECACAGLPDPQGLSGEVIAAWLVPRNSDARPPFSELAKLLRRRLEPYKTPRKFFWTDRIPRSAAGKVLRRQLREP